MTRRERMEAKIEKREEWAAKAKTRSDSRFAAFHSIADNIPLGQPILVGHHSEKRHRRDIDRMQSNLSKSCEESALAKHHESKAAGLADQLDRCIFSDDENAVDAIRARISELETERADRKRANAAYKKGGRAALVAACGESVAADFDRLRALTPYHDRPFPSYSLTNLGANIRRLEGRIVDIERRNARAARADAAGGVAIEYGQDVGGATRTQVTFAEKPEYSIIGALKAAGFHWSGGSWFGVRSNLPASVLALTTAPVVANADNTDERGQTRTNSDRRRTLRVPGQRARGRRDRLPVSLRFAL